MFDTPPEQPKAGPLDHVHGALARLEAAARQLPNQNLADVIGNAVRKVKQATEHADASALPDLLRKLEDAEEALAEAARKAAQ